MSDLHAALKALEQFPLHVITEASGLIGREREDLGQALADGDYSRVHGLLNGSFYFSARIGGLTPETLEPFIEALRKRKPLFGDKERRRAQEAAERLDRDAKFSSSLVLLPGESVAPEPISWIWDGWLAEGKLHILAGAPGTGKTTIALALAATVTMGGRWPDGSRASPGSVLIASFEDGVSDTLAPRSLAMGADMSRIKFLSGVREGDKLRSLRASDHASLLAEAIRDHDVRLVIVDPVISALGAFDSHRNAETRQALQPLVDAVSGTGAAMVGIAHFSKGTAGRDPLERVSGSLAFGALARVVMGAARVKTDGEERRLFLRVKSNIGLDGGGFGYVLDRCEITGGIVTARVLWGETLEGTARELLAEADMDDDDGEGGALSDAKQFLAGLLADGPVPTKLIEADAKGAGYSWATMRRAQKSLGVGARKDGMKNGWKWALSAAPQQDGREVVKEGNHEDAHEDAQQENLSAFGKNERLRRCSSTTKMLNEGAHKKPIGKEGAHPTECEHLHEHLRHSGNGDARMNDDDAAPQHEGDTLPTTDEGRYQEAAEAQRLAHQWRVDGYVEQWKAEGCFGEPGRTLEDADLLASGLLEDYGHLLLRAAGFPQGAIAEAIEFGRDSPAEMLRDWVEIAERTAPKRDVRTLQ